MPVRLSLPSFAAGELSELLWSRVDLAKYQVGLATCLNWYILPQGGATTRPGSAFCGEIYDSTVRGRLFGFQFRTFPAGQNYALEFGNFTMRVIMNGGYVLDSTVNITGITNAANAVVSLPGHAYVVGDDLYFDSILGMVQLNRRRFRVIAAIPGVSITIALNTVIFTPWTSGGTASRIYTVVSPYAAADLPLLKKVQSQDVMTFTHPSYDPTDLTRTGHAAWAFTVKTFAPSVVAPAAPTSTAPGAGNDYVVTAVSDITGEESLQSVTVSSTTTTSTIGWTAVAGCTYYNIYRAVSGVFGFIGRATQAVGFIDTSVKPDTVSTPPQQRTPFTGVGNRPGCSVYHSGRQWYARSDISPQTLWASAAANIKSMAVSVPTRDNDAITRTIASQESNEIQHMLSATVLIIFTSGAEHKGQAADIANGVITPAKFSTFPQGSTGISTNIPPILIRNSIVYVASSLQRVMDMNYDLSTDTWISRDVSILAQHLFENNTMLEWAYGKDPDSILWSTRDDGTLLGFTYQKDQDVYAWHRHATQGTYESICSIQEGPITAVYVQVARTVGGVTKRYVERFATRYTNTVFDAWAVDAGVNYNGRNTDTTKILKIAGGSYNTGDVVALSAIGHTPFSAASVGRKYILRSGQNQVTITVTVFTSNILVSATLDYSPAPVLQNAALSDWALAITQITGLWHIEGMQPAILADGAVIDTTGAVVQNGTYTLPNAAGQVVCGLGYVCDLETLNIDDPGPSTIQGKLKTIANVTIGVKKTRGLKVGPTLDSLRPIKERRSEVMGYPTQLMTGQETIKIESNWNTKGRMFVRQQYPLPATVTGIFPEFEIGE